MAGSHAASTLCPSFVVPSTVNKDQVPLGKVLRGSEVHGTPADVRSHSSSMRSLHVPGKPVA